MAKLKTNGDKLTPMKARTIFIQSILIAAFALTSCESQNPPTPTALLLPTATAIPITPTPIKIGQAITFDGLQVSVESFELTGRYTTQFNTVREPPAGVKFLWVQVGLKNVTSTLLAIPATEHFSALHERTEFKTTYGYRQNFLDYTTLPDKISPNQEIKAWLRFEIPAALDPSSLWFAYLPQSSRVNFLPPESPAWGDHPEYLWKLSP